MGRIAVVLDVEATTDEGEYNNEIKIDLSDGDVILSPVFAPAGDDSPPLDNDYALTVSVPTENHEAVIGYLDTDNQNQAGRGEKRLYARDSGGTIVATVWIYNDGRVRIENNNGSIELAANGSSRLENSSGYLELGSDGTMDVNGNLTVDP
jgi:hypothetical protein